MFRPVIPASGLAGWNFLQATYDRQLKSFSQSPQIRNDQDYLAKKLAQPITIDAFLDDRRLLRTALTAFGLGGEEWKRGFIKKILTEAADPQSTFLARLNNTQYSRFAEAFKPSGRMISVTETALATINAQFGAASFETAVGEIDNTLRLSLNFRSEIGALAHSGSSDETILFRLLGNVPVRTVLERATNLPADIRALPIERQAELLKDGLAKRFGVRDLAKLSSPEIVSRIVERYNALEASARNVAAGPGASVLALFGGIGSSAAENLFRSRLS